MNTHSALSFVSFFNINMFSCHRPIIHEFKRECKRIIKGDTQGFDSEGKSISFSEPLHSLSGM